MADGYGGDGHRHLRLRVPRRRRLRPGHDDGAGRAARRHRAAPEQSAHARAAGDGVVPGVDRRAHRRPRVPGHRQRRQRGLQHRLSGRLARAHRGLRDVHPGPAGRRARRPIRAGPQRVRWAAAGRAAAGADLDLRRRTEDAPPGRPHRRRRHRRHRTPARGDPGHDRARARGRARGRPRSGRGRHLVHRALVAARGPRDGDRQRQGLGVVDPEPRDALRPGGQARPRRLAGQDPGLRGRLRAVRPRAARRPQSPAHGRSRPDRLRDRPLGAGRGAARLDRAHRAAGRARRHQALGGRERRATSTLSCTA